MLYFHRITVETVIQHWHQILNDHSEIHCYLCLCRKWRLHILQFCLVHLMYKIRLNSDLSLWNDTTTSYSSKMFQPSHKTEKSGFHCFNYQIQYLVGCTVAIKTKRPTLESFQPFIGQIQHVIIALNIISHSICLKIPLRH